MEQPPPPASSNAPNAAKSAAPKSKKGRKGKHPKPKMTKEERRSKYTDIARTRREKALGKQRDKTLICYKCRKRGHSSVNCTEVGVVTGDGDTTNDGVDNDGNNAAGEEESNNAKRKRLKQQHKKVPGSICYKCGSTDHRIQICPKIKKYITTGQTKIDFGKIGNLPYANCYVCNKSGHLASFCPESKNGVFPLGGSCRECGSVDHFAADCPTKKKENDGGGGSEDGEDSNSVTIEQYLEDPVEGDGAKEKDARKQSAKKKRKVVNF